MSAFTGFVQAGLQLGLNTILITPKRGFSDITTPDGKTIPDITAQVVIEESHHDELEITDHPVQQGAMISDHAFKRPAELTLSLGWSNSPAIINGLLNAALAAGASMNSTILGASNIYSVVSGVAGLQGSIDNSKLPSALQSSQNGTAIGQINDIYNKLLALQEKRALFTIYTGKRKYVNMVCKTLTVQTDFKSEHSLPIRMVCKQVIIVDTQVATLPAGTQANPQNTAAPVNSGTVSPTTISTAAQAKLIKSLPASIPGVD